MSWLSKAVGKRVSGGLLGSIFGGQGALAGAYGGSVDWGKSPSVPSLWNPNDNVDPLIRYIQETKGAPHGTDPEAWWNREWLGKGMSEFVNSLSTEDQLKYLQNVDFKKLSDDFKKVYGRPFDFNTTPIGIQAAGIKSFKNMVGRDINESEWAQLLPAFQGKDAAITGKAAVAQYAEAYKKTPEYLKTQAGKFSGDVGQVFQSLMGRDPTAQEVDYYGQKLATGEWTPYEISQYVQQTPEFQTKRDTEFRQGLSGELEGYDTSFFNRAMPNIISQQAKAMGGAGTSSALDFALTDLMGKMAENRGQYLAGLSAEQYGGNKAAARGDYQTTTQNLWNTLQQNKARSQGLMDYYGGRAAQGADYERQMSDYLNYLNSVRQPQTNFFDYLNAGLNIANTGANVFKAFA